MYLSAARSPTYVINMFVTCGIRFTAAAVLELVIILTGEPYVKLVTLDILRRMPVSVHAAVVSPAASV
jgi:hypothetical protein